MSVSKRSSGNLQQALGEKSATTDECVLVWFLGAHRFDFSRNLVPGARINNTETSGAERGELFTMRAVVGALNFVVLFSLSLSFFSTTYIDIIFAVSTYLSCAVNSDK